MELQELRDQIEQLDQKLLSTLEQRFKVAKQIATIKKDQDTIYDSEREQKLLDQWLQHNLDDNFVRALFHLILNESRNLMIRNDQ